MDSPLQNDSTEAIEVPEAPEIIDAPVVSDMTDVSLEQPNDSPAEPLTEDSSSTGASTISSSDTDDNGILHPEEEIQFGELEPNSTYERNGYEYTTDDLGRPMRVSGTLRLEPGERTRLQTEVGHMGDVDDEGGHLIGTRFDGPTDAFNLIPQNANLNRGEWKSMENSWAEALAQDKDVKVIIEPIYGNDSVRPESFDVVTQINGELVYRNFGNRASEDAL